MRPHNYAVVFLPAVILLTNAVLLIFSAGFYQHEFEKLGVYSIIEKEHADAEVRGLQGYFIGKEETLQTTLFNPKERVHLLEVRSLMRKLFFLWISILVLFLLLLLLHPNFFWVFFWGSLAALLFIAVIILVTLPAFSQAFWNFHLVFFEDSSWQLVPGKDALLTLFPEQFFKDFFVRWMIGSALASVVLAGSAYFLQKFKRKRQS